MPVYDQLPIQLPVADSFADSDLGVKRLSE